MTGRFGSLNAEHQMPCKSRLAFTKVSRIERRNIVRTATQNHFCHLGKPDFLAMGECSAQIMIWHLPKFPELNEEIFVTTLHSKGRTRIQCGPKTEKKCKLEKPHCVLPQMALKSPFFLKFFRMEDIMGYEL